jgi:hydroxypyruvate reductase
MYQSPKDFLLNLYESCLNPIRGEKVVTAYLPKPPKGRTIVVGAGKAAAAMAQAVEAHYAGTIDAGLVVTRHGHSMPLQKIKLIEADHPVPGKAGQKAAEEILNLVSRLEPNDLLLCLFSGGGSALLTLPAPGIKLSDLKKVNEALLKERATIHEINCVRKHLSAISGGRLARAANGARVVSLIISDVPDDDLSVIASGPTVGDPTTFADALEVLERYNISTPPPILAFLKEARGETIKPGDPIFKRVTNILIATPQDALEAAAAYARHQLVTPYILGNSIEGEAHDVALVMAGITKQVLNFNQPFSAPCVILSGGETTVTVKGKGKGGRNTEFLLYFLIAMKGNPYVYAISCDTDGTDGTENNTGAIMLPQMYEEAKTFDATPMEYASNNDSYSFFKRCNGLVVTGPTRTNVNDFRAIYIRGKA